jgi:hypothetical protein
MSLTDTIQNQIPSPVTKYITWAGGSNELVYFDKESQTKVAIPLPCTFVVLDTLATIRGYNDADECGIYANEVRNVVTEDFVVRTFGNKARKVRGKTLATGKYRDIKGNLEGGKFATSVYAYMNNELVNIVVYGSALNAWIDATIKTDGHQVIWGAAIEPSKKGATKYFIPIIAKGEKLSAEELAPALEADKKLKEYFKAKNIAETQAYMQAMGAEEVDSEEAGIPVEDLNPNIEGMNLPF